MASHQATFVDLLIENVYDAIQLFLDDLLAAVLRPGTSWQVVFIGALFAQGPIQLWEAGILDAIEKFKGRLATVAVQAFNEAVIIQTASLIYTPRFNQRVFTGTECFNLVLRYLLVDSQNTQLFTSSGLTGLTLRLEARLASPLRKILALVRGGRLFSLAQTAIGVLSGTAIALLRVGGILSLSLVALKVLNDVQSNQASIFRRALKQTNPRVIDLSLGRRRSRL